MLAVAPAVLEICTPAHALASSSMERVWHYLRSHWLANSVFPSLADIIDACETAWQRFAADPGLVPSLCAVAWAPATPALQA
ncbi:MAG: hypothetical protein ACREFH_05060 [Stellaceae bacterium]